MIGKYQSHNTPSSPELTLYLHEILIVEECILLRLYMIKQIEDGNTLELFTLDLHCARIHREKWDIALKNIEILILAA
jgi:hypothetical protein